MKDFDQAKKYGALVPFGKRIDHAEDTTERQRRELGAAFNRMSSSSDAEAYSAFERARRLMIDIGTNFDAIWKASRETSSLQDINKDLGKQLKSILHENAKFRAMHVSYRIKGEIIRASRLAGRFMLRALPIVACLALYAFGIIEADMTALLLVPIGLYNIMRGLTSGIGARMIFGIILVLASLTAHTVIAQYDTPTVLQHRFESAENMNHDAVLGPRTFFIDYPLSQTTMITTIMGIRDTLKIRIGDDIQPKEILCAKYYANSIRVPQRDATTTFLPDKPDIFHSKPIAVFGDCNLYDKLIP